MYIHDVYTCRYVQFCTESTWMRLYFLLIYVCTSCRQTHLFYNIYKICCMTYIQRHHLQHIYITCCTFSHALYNNYIIIFSHTIQHMYMYTSLVCVCSTFSHTLYNNYIIIHLATPSTTCLHHLFLHLVTPFTTITSSYISHTIYNIFTSLVVCGTFSHTLYNNYMVSCTTYIQPHPSTTNV